MKIVAINGSPRKDGNTNDLLTYLLEEAKSNGAETELIQLAGKPIHGCIACFKCFENLDKRCAVKNDAANVCIEKMLDADGIVLGSPVYFQDVTAEMKALIDRAGFVGLANGRMFKDKVGASLAAFRRSGGTHTIESMNHFFLSNEIIIAGRATTVAREKGEVAKDEEGVDWAKLLGRKMVWIIRKLSA
jgi:multimeric flavodoxin WrbA